MGGTELVENFPITPTRIAPGMTQGHGKSQAEVASEAGFINPNMMSMIKAGTTKLALDRVTDLGARMDTDPARGCSGWRCCPVGAEDDASVVDEVFGTLVQPESSRLDKDDTRSFRRN